MVEKIAARWVLQVTILRNGSTRRANDWQAAALVSKARKSGLFWLKTALWGLKRGKIRGLQLLNSNWGIKYKPLILC
jgi:hypothetical protein